MVKTPRPLMSERRMRKRPIFFLAAMTAAYALSDRLPMITIPDCCFFTVFRLHWQPSPR